MNTASSTLEHEIEICHESVGGRLEPDGTFRGIRWRSVGVEPMDGSEPQLEMTPSVPSAADMEEIKALVAEVMRRRPIDDCPKLPDET